MTNPDANFDSLLDAFSDLIAAKLGARLAGSAREGGKVQKRLLSVEEAAVYLGRSKEAVQHMIASGKLPVVKSDRRVFLDVKDLDQWIDRCKIQ
jgi:excisionase family DNA binding protein